MYAYFAEAGLFYLVEEWVEGDTLTQKLQKEGCLNESLVQQILVNLLPVVGYIHQKQIIHRDIKPDNVILRCRDAKPVLIDFGAVKETMGAAINSQGKSSYSIVVGTPGFMPSEQMTGRPIYASDLYSLGLTIIYLLTGKIPQEMNTDPLTGEILWKRYAPQVSSHLAAVLDKTIQLQPRDRFSTAQQLLDSLATPGFPAKTVASTPPTSVSAIDTQAIYPSTFPTQPIPGFPTQPMPRQPFTPPVSTGEWKKAVLTGSLIGGSILAGAFLIRGQLSGFGNQVSTPEPTPSPSQSTPSQSTKVSSNTQTPKPSVTPSPSIAPPQAFPKENADSPPPESSNQSIDTNATIVGEPGSKNIRSRPGTNYGVKHIAYPGDRIKVLETILDQGGYRWYKVYFPKSGAEGWIAAQLLQIDGQDDTTASQPNPPKRNPANRNSVIANATIVGEPGKKFIRSGPGTDYSVRHYAYPGDRVKVLGTSMDKEGYRWHRVYFPKSRAEGWIAAQLLEMD